MDYNKQNKLQDVPEEKRAEMLRAMSYKTEHDRVRRHYTTDQRAEMETMVVNESISLMDKKEEFKKIQKEFGAAFKEANGNLSEALKNIKRGYTDNEETVYFFPDEDNDEMHIFDGKGIYIKSRPMFPEERQTKIVEMRTGTHN